VHANAAISGTMVCFDTINCEERFRNQLALPDVSERLFETVRHRQAKFLW